MRRNSTSQRRRPIAGLPSFTILSDSYDDQSNVNYKAMLSSVSDHQLCGSQTDEGKASKYIFQYNFVVQCYLHVGVPHTFLIAKVP